jgi:hypothetical protein
MRRRKHPVSIAYDPEDFVARVRDGLRIEELASIMAYGKSVGATAARVD